jgi:hypothetical protein
LGKLIGGILIFGVLFFLAINTSMMSTQTMNWVDANPKAPKVLFWTGWWCDLMGDKENAEKAFWQLYIRYPQENAIVAEGIYRIAEIKADGTVRLACLEYCQIVMERYSAEEKWRMKASQLYDQVKNNVR